jgi:hypothetical protein
MDRCIVSGCLNQKGECSFEGNICMPCYRMLVIGKASQSTNFISKLESEIAGLEAYIDAHNLGYPCANCGQ